MALIDLIAAERERVADFGDSLSPEELSAQSLCEHWSVHDVLGHLLMPMVTPLPRFALAVARNRFNVDRAILTLSKKVATRPDAEITQGLRERSRHPFKPPGFGHEAPLTDLLVHTQDMAIPLGREVRPSSEAVLICLDFVTTPKGLGAFPVARLDGCRLVASDADWSHGDGAVVNGAALDLLLAMTGRPAVLERLDGPGVDLLAERLG